MKILLLSNKSPWPPKDGGSSATMNTIKGLAAKEASVTVLAFNTLKHYTDINDIPGTFPGFRFVTLDSRIRPFHLLANLFFSTSPYTLTRFRSDSYSEKLRAILKNGFDIVQVEGLAMTCYLPIIRKHSSAKVIFRPHNIENIIWSQLADEEINILRRLYFRITALKTKKIERKITDHFDAVAAMTVKDMDWFLHNSCSRPFIVASPSPETTEPVPVKTVPLSVCFIGALDWRPNINGLKWLVNEVWPLVILTLPEASLYIAGRNPARNVENICRGKNVFYKGETESSSEFMADKNILAVPLFSGSGIRMKILEGMSLGKCIVATPAAAEGIIFEDKKNIYIAGEARHFATLITDLLTNDHIRNETGMNARENVRKNYDILASAEELMKFYTRLT
jgi:polysaccharide biosynthesis protein PslH